MKLSVRAFSSSFFILSFSLRVLVLEALFLHQLCLNECFFQNERTKKSTRHPQHPLLSLPVFVGENSLLSIRFTQPHNNFSLLSILLLSLKTHLRNSKRVFKGGLKRREFTKGLVLSFVLSLGTLYIVKKKEEDL